MTTSRFDSERRKLLATSSLALGGAALAGVLGAGCGEKKPIEAAAAPQRSDDPLDARIEEIADQLEAALKAQRDNLELAPDGSLRVSGSRQVEIAPVHEEADLMRSRSRSAPSVARSGGEPGPAYQGDEAAECSGCGACAACLADGPIPDAEVAALAALAHLTGSE